MEKRRKKKTKKQITIEKLSNKVFLNTTYQNRKNNTNKWIQIQDTNIKYYKTQHKNSYEKPGPKTNTKYQGTAPLFNVYSNYSLQKSIQKKIKVTQKQGKTVKNKAPTYTQIHCTSHCTLQKAHLRKRKKKKTRLKTKKTPILLNTKRKIPRRI
jgi:hypothetical protein